MPASQQPQPVLLSKEPAIAQPTPPHIGASSRRAQLQRQLENDVEELTVQQESMEQSQHLTEKMGLMLSHFDERLAKLEAKILPIHKSTQKLTELHENIDKALAQVETIVDCFDMPQRQDKYISKGPVDMQEYVVVVAKMKEALVFLKALKYKSAETAQTGLKALLVKAQIHFDLLFRKTLTQNSSPTDVVSQGANVPEIPEEALQSLTQLNQQLVSIDNIVHDHSQHYELLEHVKTYAQIRSTYLVKSLTPLAATCGSGSGGGSGVAAAPGTLTDGGKRAAGIGGSGLYQRGSASIIALTSAFLRLAKTEKDLVTKLIIKPQAQPCFLQTIAAATDIVMEAAETLIARVKRTLQRKEAGDIYLLIDVAANLTTLANEYESTVAYAGPKGAELVEFISSCKSTIMFFLKDFCDEVKLESKAVLPADGTVHELSSVTLNTLKRLLEYQATLEPMLQEGWGSGLAAKTFSSLVFELLESLFTNLEVKSRAYKRPVLSTIFLMNNYYFVTRQIRHLGLGALAGQAAEEMYDKGWQKQRDLYRDSWKTCFDYLMDTTHVQAGGAVKALTKPQREAIKEKFKSFNAEFDMNYNWQTACTVPDSDLRNQLLSDLKAVLIPLYARFQEKYSQIEFAKNPSKYVKYDRVSLESALDQFFIGSM